MKNALLIILFKKEILNHHLPLDMFVPYVPEISYSFSHMLMPIVIFNKLYLSTAFCTLNNIKCNFEDPFKVWNISYWESSNQMLNLNLRITPYFFLFFFWISLYCHYKLRSLNWPIVKLAKIAFGGFTHCLYYLPPMIKHDLGPYFIILPSIFIHEVQRVYLQYNLPDKPHSATLFYFTSIFSLIRNFLFNNRSPFYDK